MTSGWRDSTVYRALHMVDKESTAKTPYRSLSPIRKDS